MRWDKLDQGPLLFSHIELARLVPFPPFTPPCGGNRYNHGLADSS